MKFVSWNVNGLRAVLKKDFESILKNFDADIFAIQETKCQKGQASVDAPEYHQYFNYAKRKGYSGTAVFTKEEPLQVIRHIFSEEERNTDKDIDTVDNEGRVLALEFDCFWFVCVYTPNAQPELARIDTRLKWGARFSDFCKELESGKRSADKACLGKKKPVVMCGDLNVAHKEIDLKNPKSNRGNPGFSDEERGDFSALLDAGFTDTFRLLYPDKEGAYSWWSYRFNARKNNAGWRIDYFLISDFVANQVEEAQIHSDVFGSDHCPVSLEISL